MVVFKFVEPPESNERPLDQKSRVKFKIMSLKVKCQMEYVPELVKPCSLFVNYDLFLIKYYLASNNEKHRVKCPVRFRLDATIGISGVVSRSMSPEPHRY